MKIQNDGNFLGSCTHIQNNGNFQGLWWFVIQVQCKNLIEVKNFTCYLNWHVILSAELSVESFRTFSTKWCNKWCQNVEMSMVKTGISVAPQKDFFLLDFLTIVSVKLKSFHNHWSFHWYRHLSMWNCNKFMKQFWTWFFCLGLKWLFLSVFKHFCKEGTIQLKPHILVKARIPKV